MNIYKFHNGAFLSSASITYSTTDNKLIISGLSEDEEADFISIRLYQSLVITTSVPHLFKNIGRTWKNVLLAKPSATQDS